MSTDNSKEIVMTCTYTKSFEVEREELECLLCTIISSINELDNLMKNFGSQAEINAFNAFMMTYREEGEPEVGWLEWLKLGNSIPFRDYCDSSVRGELTLEALKKGLSEYVGNNPECEDFGMIDMFGAHAILEIALFGEVIYG